MARGTRPLAPSTSPVPRCLSVIPGVLATRKSLLHEFRKVCRVPDRCPEHLGARAPVCLLARCVDSWVAAHCRGAFWLWPPSRCGPVTSWPVCCKPGIGIGWRCRWNGGATWVGVLFLLFSTLLLVDFVTAGGWLMTRWLPPCALGGGGRRGAFGHRPRAGSAVTSGAGLRSAARGLPRERDGTTLVAISDLHVGTLIGERWVKRLIGRVNDLKPTSSSSS